MTSLGLGKQLFLSYLLADRARRISYRVFTDILVQSVTSTTTSNVTSRHRGPKPKLRAGVACAALFPTLQFYLHNRLSYYVAHYISSSSVVSRALCPTRAFEVRASSSSARLPLCQISFFFAASIALGEKLRTESSNHSPSLFDADFYNFGTPSISLDRVKL